MTILPQQLRRPRLVAPVVDPAEVHEPQDKRGPRRGTSTGAPRPRQSARKILSTERKNVAMPNFVDLETDRSRTGDWAVAETAWQGGRRVAMCRGLGRGGKGGAQR